MIINLRLINFRNHLDFSIASKENFIIISGANGSGKTNVLESISLFSLGKGLKNAKLEDLFAKDLKTEHQQLAVHMNSSLKNNLFSTSLCYQRNIKTKKITRYLKIDDKEIKKKAALLNYIKIFYFIPQMSNLFIDTPSVRRKFLDRMVFNFFPEHGLNVIRYEYYVQSRMKLLLTTTNNTWITTVEEKIAYFAVKIMKMRYQYSKMISRYLENLKTAFIKPSFNVVGFLDEEFFYSLEEAELVRYIIDRLKQNRPIDLKRKRTEFGPHKTDILCKYPEKQIEASHCSTGEQKAMLIAILLAQIHAINCEQQTSPIFLLDELFAHFDKEKQELLIEELDHLKTQAWVTSTDPNLYKNFPQEKTQHINIK